MPIFPQSVHPLPRLVSDTQTFATGGTGTINITFSLDSYFGPPNDTNFQMGFSVATDSATMNFNGANNMAGLTLSLPSGDGSVSFGLTTTDQYFPGYYGYRVIDISTTTAFNVIGNPNPNDGLFGVNGPNALHPPVHSNQYPLEIRSATVGQGYLYQFVIAAGGTPPFTVAGGSLPPGLALSSAGALEGSPLFEGVFQFTIQAGTGSSTIYGQYILRVLHPVIELSPSITTEAHLFCASRSEQGGIPCNPNYHWHFRKSRYCVLAKALVPNNYPCVFNSIDDGLSWTALDQMSAPGYQVDTDVSHTTEFVWASDGIAILYFVYATYSGAPSTKDWNVQRFNLLTGTWIGDVGDALTVNVTAIMKQVVFTVTGHLRLFYVTPDSSTPTNDDLVQIDNNLESTLNWIDSVTVDSAPNGLVAKLFYCAYVPATGMDYCHCWYNIQTMVGSITHKFAKTYAGAIYATSLMASPPAFDPSLDTMDTVYFTSGQVVYDQQNQTLDWSLVGKNAFTIGDPTKVAMREDDAKSIYVYHENVTGGGFSLELVEGNASVGEEAFINNNDIDSNAFTFPVSTYLVQDWYGTEIMFWVGRHNKDSEIQSDSIFYSKKYYRSEDGVPAWSNRIELVSAENSYPIAYTSETVFAAPGTS